MAEPPLTLKIRNLTPTLFALKLWERFDSAKSPESNGGGFSKITRSLSGLVSSNNNTTPSSAQLAQKSESFKIQDVSIPVGPFESKDTGIQTSRTGTLRLTFEVERQRYRLDTPTLRSTVLTPLSPNPQFEFTAVYLEAHSHLALYSSAKLESWMSRLKNETPLSALSIPGTHNSPTYHKALPSVRCQSVGVKFQLENGVRFLDIRVQPESSNDTSKDGLILVHSAFPVALTGTRYLRGLVDTVFTFLNANPTETVIMSIKREGIGRSTDEHLSRILHDHYANDDRRWFTENRIPNLGEVRSKIVLLRRFSIHESLKDGDGWAMDGESWPDNCADGLCSSGEIRVQDFYEVAYSENIEKKIEYCSEHLVRAAKAVCPPPDEVDGSPEKEVKRPIFMNFLSASNFWRANCWPEKIAARVNPAIVEYLCRHHHAPPVKGHDSDDEKEVGHGSTGVVVCDWVGHGGDWDLVRCIVGMNARIELEP